MNTHHLSILIAFFAASSFADATTLPSAELKIKNESHALTIEIQPVAPTHLNLEAPIKLEVTGAETEKPGPFGKSAFDSKTLSFKIALKKSGPQTGALKLTYSICGDDNKLCRRVVESRSF